MATGESSPAQGPRWQVWLVGLGDFLRTPAGEVRRFSRLDEAQQTAESVGGIVQLEGAPLLGGFDRVTGL
jgi:hypothetical protein